MRSDPPVSSQVGCLEQPAWWQRVRIAVTRRGDRLALLLLGVGILVAPALLPDLADARTTTLTLGVAIVVLGVILPSVAEAEVGVQGIRFSRVVEARDAEFQSRFSEAEIEELVAFAMYLGVARAQAGRLVSDACVRTYRDWHLARNQEPWLVALCHLVRRVLRAGSLGMLRAVPPDEVATDGVLDRLDLRGRALLLLHVYEGLTDTQVARILDEPLERTRDGLEAALAVVAATPDPTMADPS